jgi:hypothetical protein
MQDALGLVFFVIFCAAIIGAAAGITWVVVRLAPPKKAEPAPKS